MAMMPALPQITLQAAGASDSSFEMTWVFAGRDFGGAELNAAVQRELLDDSAFLSAGPRESRRVLSEETEARLASYMHEQFAWTPGEWSLSLSAAVDGTTFTWSRTAVLSDDQVESMKRSANYYAFGFGIVFGGHLNPVGDASPGHHVRAMH